MMTQISKRKKQIQGLTPGCCARLSERLDDRLFRALGDPTRLHILVCLAGCAEPQSVNDIAACCYVDLSVVSRHLKLLQDADVLAMHRRGRFTLYSVRHHALATRLRALAGAIDGCCPKLSRSGR